MVRLSLIGLFVVWFTTHGVCVKGDVANLPAEVLSAHTQAVVTLRLEWLEPAQMQALAEDSRIMAGLVNFTSKLQPLRTAMMDSGVEQLIVIVQTEVKAGQAKAVILTPFDEQIDLDRFQDIVTAGSTPGEESPVPTLRMGEWIRFGDEPLPEALQGATLFRWWNALEHHDDRPAISLTAVRPDRGNLPVRQLVRRLAKDEGVLQALGMGLGSAEGIRGSIDWRDGRVRAEARFEMDDAGAASALVLEHAMGLRRALGEVRRQAARLKGNPDLMSDPKLIGAISSAAVLTMAIPSADGRSVVVSFDTERARLYQPFVAGALVASMLSSTPDTHRRRNAMEALEHGVAYHFQKTGQKPESLDELWVWFDPLVDEVRLDPVTGHPGWLEWRPLGEDPIGPLIITKGDDPNNPRHLYLDHAGTLHHGSTSNQ